MNSIMVSAELMDEYRRMSSASPGKKMRICTGTKELYSIGDDGNLYLLTENVKEHKGWERINLTENLGKSLKCASLEVITFEVRKQGQETVAVFAAKCDGKNALFYSRSPEPGAFVWNRISADEPQIANEDVAALYLPILEKGNLIVCDLKAKNRIRRWLIEVKEQKGNWTKLELPADFAITEQTLSGRAGKSKVDGLYTLGNLAGEAQLLYCPLYHRFNRDVPPSSLRFALDKTADAIAVWQNGDYTDLFACGEGSLYVYPAELQKDSCRPILLAESEEFWNVSSLCVYRTDTEMVVSGIGKGGELFSCRTSDEDWKKTEAWKNVSVIASGMQYAECGWDSAEKKEVGFGVTRDGKYLRQMERLAETGFWNSGVVHIPDLKKAAEKTPSYVTRIQIVNDEAYLQGQSVKVSAARPCQVYINEQYYILDGRQQEIPCDETGSLRIAEEARDLCGTEIMIEFDGISQTVCPSKESMNRLFALDSPEKLKAARVDGNPLADGSCSSEQLAAIARTLDALGKHPATEKLFNHAQGSAAVKPAATPVGKRNLTGIRLEGYAKAQSGVRLAFSGGALQGLAQAEQEGYRLMSVPGSGICAIQKTALSDEAWWNVVYTSASEFFEKLWELGSKAVEAVISCIKDVWHFTLQVGKTVYTFIMDTAEKLSAGIQKLFEYIKVGIQKLIKYVNYFFDWEDIKRMSAALENAVLNRFDVMEERILDTRGKLHGLTETITSLIDKWAEIEHDDVTKDSLEKRGENRIFLDVKQSYLIDYSRQNLAQSALDEAKVGELDDTDFGELQKHIQNIGGFIETEGVILDDFIKKVKNELLDPDKLKAMSFGDICKKILAMLSNAIIYSLENILYSLLEIVKLLIEWMKKILSTPIHIPVISDILKDVFGIEEKSVLEIGCVIISTAAVPLLKLCGQGRLFREEVFRYIEQTSGNNCAVQKGLCAVETAETPSVPEAKMDAFAALHIICGIANLCETFVALKVQTQQKKVGGENEGAANAGALAFSGWDVAAAVLGFIDGGCYLAAVQIYQPLANIGISISSGVASMVKYAGLILKKTASFADALGERVVCKLPETLQKIGGAVFNTAAFEGLGVILNMSGAGVLTIISVCHMAIGAKSKNKKEKELLYLDGSSLIGDNLRIMLDNIIPYVEEDPEVWAALIGSRAFFSLAYSALQIAEGSIAL